MPWTNQDQAGGVALGLATLYALTPLKRMSQDRCREVCAARPAAIQRRSSGRARRVAVRVELFGLRLLGSRHEKPRLVGKRGPVDARALVHSEPFLHDAASAGVEGLPVA